jgi:hypothetical protein
MGPSACAFRLKLVQNAAAKGNPVDRRSRAAEVCGTTREVGVKVTFRDADVLVLEHVPWVLGVTLVTVTLVIVTVGLVLSLGGPWPGLAIAAGGAVFGGLFCGVFIRRTRLVLDRRAGIAELKRRTVLGTKVSSWPLVSLARATVEESRDSESRSVTRRPVLLFADGSREPVNPVYVSGGGAARTAATINDWLGVGPG